MTETKQPDFPLDNVIHEQARLAILTYLAGSPQRMVTFSELKQKLELTAGNLSVQLRNLEAAAYVHITKSIEGRRPVTRISLTPRGFAALTEYIRRMEEIISTLKCGKPGHPD
jgi:DNA-binding MarR family transcriptional regulator